MHMGRCWCCGAVGTIGRELLLVEQCGAECMTCRTILTEPLPAGKQQEYAMFHALAVAQRAGLGQSSSDGAMTA